MYFSFFHFPETKIFKKPYQSKMVRMTNGSIDWAIQGNNSPTPPNPNFP